MDFFYFIPMSDNKYTAKELQQKIRKQKSFILIQVTVVVLMTILAIVATLDKGTTAVTFLPLFFIPMIFVMVFELKKLKKELAKLKK